MKNIWILLTKYNAFFLFIVFFTVSLLLVVTRNDFQRSAVFNSSNSIIGGIYAESSRWTNYLQLADANQTLLDENARLWKELSLLKYADTSRLEVQLDTAGTPMYEYLPARVINNSIHQKNNYLTINKGTKQGVQRGMGVISSTGVVGIVLYVSEHFATVQSLLHNHARISASLAESGTFGSLVWGDQINSQYARLNDIPTHVEVSPGERVITSGYSLFPPGIPIGEVAHIEGSGKESFLNITIKLNTDFHNLQYAYVIVTNFADELEALEATTRADD